MVLAATGHGLYVSRDGGAVWEAFGAGLPFNSKIAGLLTHRASPGQVLAVSDNTSLWGSVQPPMVLRSLDGGRHWTPAAAGLPDVPATAWALDPNDPDTIFVASWEYVFRSTDGGLSWQVTRLDSNARNAVAVAPSDGNIVYLGGRPALRSVDRGTTWEPMPVIVSGQDQQAQDVSGLVVAKNDPMHVWAGLDGGGVFESRDGGRSWQQTGWPVKPFRWLAAGADQRSRPVGPKNRYRSMPVLPRTVSIAETDPMDAGVEWSAATQHDPFVCWRILGRLECCGRPAMEAAYTIAPMADRPGRTSQPVSATTWPKRWLRTTASPMAC